MHRKSGCGELLLYASRPREVSVAAPNLLSEIEQVSGPYNVLLCLFVSYSSTEEKYALNFIPSPSQHVDARTCPEARGNDSSLEKRIPYVRETNAQQQGVQSPS